MLLLLTFLILPLLGIILFTIGVFYSFKKKWKTVARLGLVFGIVLFFELWQFDYFPGAASYHLASDCKRSTGYFFAPKEIFCYESPRSFNGDGYSIYVYELNPDALKYFSSRMENDIFFKNYPEKSDDRNDWNIIHWEKTPIAGDDTTILAFATMTYFDSEVSAEQKQDLKKYVSLANALAKKEGNFIAFTYKYDKKHPLNADLYIVSPGQRLFFVFNSNT